ncbi:MAG: hypothetical protein ACOX2O_02850 [Bdellovibrionota bacterium]|jgi:hypothetical protein
MRAAISDPNLSSRGEDPSFQGVPVPPVNQNPSSGSTVSLSQEVLKPPVVDQGSINLNTSFRLNKTQNPDPKKYTASQNEAFEKILAKCVKEVENELRNGQRSYGFTSNQEGSPEERCLEGSLEERRLVNIYVDQNACRGIDLQPPAIHDLLLLERIKHLTDELHERLMERLKPSYDGDLTELSKRISSIELSEEFKNDIIESRVRAWIVGGKLVLSAVMGRDPKHQKKTLEKLVAAVELVQSMGINDVDVAFEGSPENLKELRKIGMLDKAPNFFVEDIDAARRALEKDLFITEGGNEVFYVAATHERLMTLTTFAKLQEVSDDRELFLKRLEELACGRKKNTVGTSNFELLVVAKDKDGQYFRETNESVLKSLFEKLVQVNNLAQSIAENEWSEKKDKVFTALKGFIETYRKNTAEIFWENDPQNEQWVTIQYAINRGLNRETALSSLPSELTGRHKVEKCGFIGWRDDNGKVHLGMRPLGFEKPSDLNKAELIMYNGHRYYLVRHEVGDGSEDTTIYWKDKNTKEWYQREYIFPEDINPKVERLQNMVLERHPDLDWSFVATFPERYSLRDPDPEFVKKYWYPERMSFVVQYGTGSAQPKALWGRQFSQSGASFKKYRDMSSGSAERQEELCKTFFKWQKWFMSELGARCSESIFENLPIGDAKIEEVPFILRNYVNGKALGRMQLLSDVAPSEEFFSSYAIMLGKLAATNIAARRKFFETLDEIVDKFDSDGNPIDACFTYPTSAFSLERVSLPLNFDAPLYGVHLAALVKKTELMLGTEKAKEVEAWFLTSFEENFNAIKRKVESKRQQFLKPIYSEYQLTEAINENYDFRRCAEGSLDGIKRVGVKLLVADIEREAAKAEGFFNTLISNVAARTDQRKLFREAIYLLDSIWLAKEHGVDYAYATINNDPTFSEASVQERIDRLNILHTSITCKTLEIPIRFLADVATDYISNIEDSSCFVAQINGAISRYLNKPRGINPALGVRFFNALQQPDRIKIYEDLGYWLEF